MNLARKIGLRIHLFNKFLNKNLNSYTFVHLFGDKKFLFLSKNTLSIRSLCNVVPIQTKKRAVKKKKISNENVGFRIAAFSTAEEYNLEGLAQDLSHRTSFKTRNFSDSCNLIDAVYAEKDSGFESQKHIFFFREGSVVMWNLTDSETQDILNFLKHYEDNGFNDEMIQNESETMSYLYSSDQAKTRIIRDSVVLSENVNSNLEKYAISNAMALSVHLGSFEANLEQYIETMEPVTEDLKYGGIIRISRDEVLQKSGQLFALRHNINLNSDLLDTPDFYWDREELENLYQMTFNYFCISKRTKVMNEKINHCIELVHLLSSHLNDKHHIRLEWMIILLIMVEVMFEVLHFLGR